VTERAPRQRVTKRERFRERLQALAIVALLPAALRVLPLRRTLALCDRFPRARHRSAPPLALVARSHRWLSHGRGPWANSCLTRAVVLYAMLRQHGYQPLLHVGLCGDASSFVAHAWVSLAGRPVGDEQTVTERYHELLVHHG
jgi:hypothetical protein